MKSLVELIQIDLPVSFQDKIQDQIISRMKVLLLDKPEYKFDVKVLLWVCVCIESLVSKEKVDKKKIVLDIYKSVYGLSMDDELIIKTNVDLLHATKRIKKKHYFRLFLTSLREVFSL